MFGLGCRVCPKEEESALRVQTPPLSIPAQGPRTGMWSTRNELGAQETQPVTAQGSHSVHTGREGREHSSLNLVVVGTKHNELR